MQNNREIKSSVFADLFGDDELVGKKNFLALYNAIHGTNLKYDETKIERKTISQSLVNTFNNDVSMEINGKLIVFIEHQSTVNRNMPLRFLEYFVHILYGIVPARARYKNVLYKIPSPEFYVFYNGKRKPMNESELKLSDAFCVPQKEPLCELKVNVVDIGGEEGLTLPIVKNCVILKEYCEFIGMMLKEKATLPENCTNEDAQVALEKVIRECITKNILTDYLTRKSTEVINMFLDEYDYETDIAVKQEEAKEEGFAEGTQQKAIEVAIELLKEKTPPETIARCVKLPLEKVLELQKQIAEKA
ncbi:MAG: Rpn family recombination-promoting nuclease/putative transposase [Treponema sp.]|nr:Rpn family recombination-promoting nuclease/putative transposase [Treponema sp.]